MSTDYFVSHILAIFILLLLAAVSSIMFKRIRFPYTIGLVIIGIVFLALTDSYQELAHLEDIKLSHDVIMYIILPTLIFDAAINIDSRLLVRNLLPVSALAIPGLIISTLIIGFLMCKFTPLHLGVAMLFGALISATDPVAVIALFNEIGAPKRLTMLVDGESLFNDATAIVAFNIVLAMILSGASMTIFTISSAAINFIYVFIGGLVVGLIIGFILTRLINLAKNEPLIQIALSTVTAYASFIIADHYLKVSGVMSTLGAGIIVSWYGSTRFTHEAKEYLKQYWEFAAFIANSFIFLMLGMIEWDLLIKQGHTPYLITYLIYTIIIVTFARFVVVYGIIPLLRLFPKHEKISMGYKTVIFWGGLRGAVPLALVLSLGPNFENRQLIVEFTLGVVLFTLLIQGTTTKPLMGFFKLGKLPLFEKIMCFQTKLETINRGNMLLEELEGKEYFSSKVIDNIKNKYVQAEETTKNELQKLRSNSEYKPDTTRRQLVWHQALSIELSAYQQLFDKGLISESVIRELNLNFELGRDKLKLGILPDLIISTIPLENKIKNRLSNLLSLIMPKNKFLTLFRERTLSTRYKMALAMIYANSQIKSILGRPPHLHADQKEIVEECQLFYEKRKDLATIQKRKLEKYIATDNIEYETLRIAAADEERDFIDKISAKGGISDSVANILTADIDGKMLKIAKHDSVSVSLDLKI